MFLALLEKKSLAAIQFLLVFMNIFSQVIMFNLKSEIFNMYSNLENRFSSSALRVLVTKNIVNNFFFDLDHLDLAEVEFTGILIFITQHLPAIKKLNQTLMHGWKTCFSLLK